MQSEKSKKLYTIVLEYDNGVTRTVKVKATSRQIAEDRALKFHPRAKGIKNHG